jgi:UDP-N-acetyl-2-amino-2-deoxyglucuronate dehydrogenase
MKKFGLIGAAGFIAPRHMKAIKDTGNTILAALDKFDSVGILDSYFPNANFFTEFERFDRHVEKLRHSESKIDFFSICSPNYLHDSHIRFGLRNDSDVICEKPLVLSPWNIDSLLDLENKSGRKVHAILQLRLHPAIIALKEKIDNEKSGGVYDIDLTYITSRGNWYFSTWKSDLEKSGGVATNIGVHFYDMLHWIFGDVKLNVVHLHDFDRAAGYLEFARARVRWFLSINYETLPEEIKLAGKRTYRNFSLNGQDYEFSDGFTELHTESYKQILEGRGYSLQEAKPAIEIVHNIRNFSPIGAKGDCHPFAKFPMSKHPFS